MTPGSECDRGNQMTEVVDWAVEFEKALPIIRGVVRGMSIPLDDVEEVVDETLVKAWKSRSKFRGNCAVSTWLITIAKHCCLDHRRKRLTRNRRIPIEPVRIEELGNHLVSPAHSIERDTSLPPFEYCVAKLAQVDLEMAEALSRRGRCDLTVKELAESLGCSIEKAVRLWRRTKEELRRLFPEYVQNHQQK